MFLVFFETPLFTRLLPDYLDDDGYRRLQKALLENPEKVMSWRVPAAFANCVGRIRDVERASVADCGSFNII